MFRRALTICACLLVTAVSAQAQQATAPPPAPPPAPPATTTADGDTRPATTTFLGDTGLWFVPTGEVLPKGRWSAGGYYTNFDYTQGFTDVSHVIGTVGYGLGRAELFGSWRVITRVDRDTNTDGHTLFNADPTYGGVVNDYPLMRSSWSGNQLGDLLVGAKINLTSESRQQPVAFAVRGVIKLPTGDENEGVGTGKADFLVDAIVSKEVNRAVELTGFGGFIVRGEPEPRRGTVGRVPMRGVGAGVPPARPCVPSRSCTARRTVPAKSTLATRSLVARRSTNRSPPVRTCEQHSLHSDLGLTWQHRNGFFARRRVDVASDRRGAVLGQYTNGAGDRMDVVGRIGYHPGVRVYVPPPRPRPAAPPAAAQNRPPTVRARCEPCTVYVGKSSTVSADAQDPDGDALTYTWSAPAGTLTYAAGRQTPWTAPMAKGRCRSPSGSTTARAARRRHGHHPGHQGSGQGGRLRGRALRLRPLQPAAGRARSSTTRWRRWRRTRRADHHRRPHRQHRHGRIQPGARRAPCEPVRDYLVNRGITHTGCAR